MLAAPAGQPKLGTDRKMFEKLRVVFTIPELRQKILLTLLFLAIYRVGFHVPLPIYNQKAEMLDATDFLNQAAIFAASDLRQATIFGLGIMPYISASIIFQLLGTVWKPLEDLRKEGETGRKKINEYTRYLTVFLCFVQSWFYVYFYLMRSGAPDGTGGLIDPSYLPDGNPLHLSFFWQLVSVMTMTCGTIFLMWLGEQIDEFGIGNGISLLIMAGILAQMPNALLKLVRQTNWELGATSGYNIETVIVLAVLFVAVIAGVVFITKGERRIPTQSAKHVRGRRVYGGGKQFLPMKLNQSGVMPIIFASSLLMIPAMFFQFLVRNGWESMTVMLNLFSPASLLYTIMYIALIYFFCYFWTAITFNPKEMADNLKDYGTFIPGYRPGKRTADYLEKVMVRITYVGAAFLAIIAILPTTISKRMDIDPNIAGFYGGTSLLIAVSVAFDLVQKIDNHLLMRNYRGLIDS
jgi:preprotein translocase subunit SecY